MGSLCESLEKYFSVKRLETYKNIAKQKNLSEEIVPELYKFNILICEELYAFISCIEICLRNTIHSKMSLVFNKESWFNYFDWEEKHSKQLAEAKIKASKIKKVADVNDIISSISFGFWCHIFDACYESSLWVKGLNKIFPGYVGKPNRKHIAVAFNSLLLLRNRIAHFEPIIKDEYKLLKYYNQMAEVMNWMCPDIFVWFKNFNKFEVLYKKLQNNDFLQ